MSNASLKTTTMPFDKLTLQSLRRRPDRTHPHYDCPKGSIQAGLETPKKRPRPLFRRATSIPYRGRFVAAVCVSSALIMLLQLFPSRDVTRRSMLFSARPPGGIRFPWDVRPSGKTRGNIIFHWNHTGTSTRRHHLIKQPSRTLSVSEHLHTEAYGDLKFSAFGETRIIPQDDYERYELYRHQLLEAMNASQPLIETKDWHDDELVGTQQTCRRNNWGRKVYPVCNKLHELRMELPWDLKDGNVHQDYDYRLKATGSFVNVWVMARPGMQKEFLVIKRYKLGDHYPLDIVDISNAKKEAIIMERLTSSDRIIDIYGYCGFSTLIEGAMRELADEVMPSGGFVSQERLDEFQLVDVAPMNNFTLTEKLDTAILMAEGIAELHGYTGGAIAHGDVYPSQWLRTYDGKLKLNDFNSAEIMDWDPVNQRYCIFSRCHLNWNRAPEDLTCGKWPADEGIDTFCMGNNIYTLLTGLWTFYWAMDQERDVMQTVVNGYRSYVDPRYRIRSRVEGKLVELMEETWVENIQERISIFNISSRLREIKALHEEDASGSDGSLRP
jgi:hypothetical protein